MSDDQNSRPKTRPQQQYQPIEDAEFIDVTQTLLNERQASQNQMVRPQSDSGPVPQGKVLRDRATDLLS